MNDLPRSPLHAKNFDVFPYKAPALQDRSVDLLWHWQELIGIGSDWRASRAVSELDIDPGSVKRVHIDVHVHVDISLMLR